MAAEDIEAQATGVDHEVVKSVAGTNFKVLGDLPAQLTGQMIQNALNHQNRVSALSEAALAASIRSLTDVDPTEAKSLKELFTGNALGEQIAALGSAIAGLQQMVKGAVTTPPTS